MPGSASPASHNTAHRSGGRPKPTPQQTAWLVRGLEQPGGKLPLFDQVGRKVNRRIVEACLDNGWAEHWFYNPIKPDWIVCKLTPLGRELAEQAGAVQENPQND